MNFIRLYEDSYQFFAQSGNEIFTPQQAEAEFRKLIAYRNTNRDLWAEIRTGNVTRRYEFDKKSGMKKIASYVL